MKNESTVVEEAPPRKLTRIPEKLDPWLKLGGLIAAGVVGYYAVLGWVQREARNAVTDEKFLQTLSARIRPTCIFNSRGSIEADIGAGEYIEDIIVNPVPKSYGYEVLVKAKRHLAYAPIITGLDVNLFPESSARGKGHEWRILLTPNSTVMGIVDESGMNTNSVYRFRLEVLH